MTMSKFSRAIQDYVSAALATEATLHPTKLADLFIVDQADLIDEHVKDLVRKAVRDEIVRRTKATAEDSGQMALFPGLPAAIRVAENDYVPRDRAVWAHLQAGRQERVENIAHAEKALALYDDDLERLRPLMEDHPDVTVADAVRKFSEPDQTGDDEVI